MFKPILGISRLIAISVTAMCTLTSLLHAENDTAASTQAFEQKLEALTDGIVASVMQENNIPGLTISVVKDGKPVLLKGYGYADIEAKKPVDPYKSMFRVGSVSKTFTWTAIMQLVEQGKVDLHANVNSYLKGFQLPEPHGIPLTLNDIMAHRPGYEDGGFGYLFTKNAEDVITPLEILKDHIPAQVNKPGVAVSYSNYATGIAGLVVENVSGQPYNDYIEEHVLGPLEMSQTSFREPLGPNHRLKEIPEHLKDDLATAYSQSAGRHKDAGFTFIHPFGPVGSASSSAADMANYMIAHLQKGRFKNSRILKEETVDLMRKRNFQDHLETTDIAHGFFNGKISGYEYWGHGGATSSFKTMMKFVPELNFGVFVSINQSPGTVPVYNIPNLLIENLFPPKEKIEFLKPTENFTETGKRFTGQYLGNRRNFSKLEAIFNLESKPITIAIDGEGYLIRADGGSVTAWVQVGPLAFRRSDTADVMEFDEDSEGNILRYHSEAGHKSYDKVGFIDTPNFFFMGMGAITLFSLTTLVWGLYRRKHSTTEKPDLYGRIAILAALGGAFWLLTWHYTLDAIDGMGEGIFYTFPIPSLVFTIWVSFAVSLLMLVLSASTIPVWQKSGWTLVRKIHHSLFGLSGLLFIKVLWDWNLLGFYY